LRWRGCIELLAPVDAEASRARANFLLWFVQPYL